MLKNKKVCLGMMLGILMVLAISTPIFAQDDISPLEPSEEDAGISSFLDHPIVKLMVFHTFNEIEQAMT